MSFNDEIVNFLINHVVLPAKLPQHEDDPNTEEAGALLLLKLLLEAVSAFLSECDLQTQLYSYIGINNPTARAVCEDVMGSSDRLVWSFPGPTISFGSHLLEEKHFVGEITSLVLGMSHEPVEVSRPTTRKAKSVVPEERETHHPGLVIEALISVLHAWGEARKGPEIVKRVRDDVNWNRSRLSWRRSPFWLVIRVGIQITLSHIFAGEQSRCQYKNFMAFLMCKICDFATKNSTGADVRMIVATKAARRLAKLGDDAFPFVEKAVGIAVGDVRANLNSLWSGVQRLDKLSIPVLQQTATENDCALRLDHSREYLRSISSLKDQKSEPPAICLSIGPQLNFKIDGLPDFQRNQDAETRVFLLTDFETWIIEHLRPWAEQQNRNELDCASLLREMRTYLDIAREEYQDNPRGLSIMLLTAMELWIALDIICLRLSPLMRRPKPQSSNWNVRLGSQHGVMPHGSSFITLDALGMYMAMLSTRDFWIMAY
ncbi:hypothetical protein SLS56_008096 [Neofusicoccum ribis]|uniref:DUF6606 domain-containing protein n=1 Tax=Neofusicoccum ribis TaxID=45134 RepID=A0ABR3SMK1_9PEZI